MRRLRRLGLGLVAVVATLAVLLAVYMRTVPSHDPEVWHLDPLVVAPLATDNFELARPPSAPEFDMAARDLRVAVGAAMDDLPRTELITTSEDGALRTWVSTSAVFAFPDYTSIRVIPLADDRSTVAIFARARYGSGDLGVNRDRTAAILSQLIQTAGVADG